MTTEAIVRPRRWPRFLQPLASRPHLATAIAVGLAAYVTSGLLVHRGITQGLVGWDTGVIVFFALSCHYMMDISQERLQRRAAEHDEGRHIMLALTTLAAVASIGALVAELSAAKGHPNGALRVGLASGTVVLSWLFVQTVFAIHYAHVYYANRAAGRKGGLEFGDEDEPDYWDFFHFSIVMGATAQTADIVIRSKPIRRIGTLHTLVAFGFNTAILATMINLAANLF
jgi:uncharacterized membrane protein